MHGEANVVQGVRLVHIDVDGSEVTADVFGGDDPVVMAEVVFRIDDATEQELLVQTFQAWERRSTALTLVHGEDGVVSLVDEDGAFQAALG